jgi:hypothetical protein
MVAAGAILLVPEQRHRGLSFCLLDGG